MGGATMAASLADSCRRLVILERGHHLVESDLCRNAKAIFGQGAFQNDETWDTPIGKEFNPGNYYFVGGNSKLYGAALFRFRAEDFEEIKHIGGISPAWPITYQEFEPWYQMAEDMYEVCGHIGDDPTEPFHSGKYSNLPVPHETSILDAASRLAKQGLSPAHLPLGVDIKAWLAGGETGWDAYPNTGTGKKDAESIGIAKALEHDSVRLETGCMVKRLISDGSGRITAVEYQKGNRMERISGKMVILSAGAVNSAAILLQSASNHYPDGLANRSDQVGRNFMNHNTHAVLSLHPFRKNPSIYQKTLYFNDYYLSGGPNNEPLGNVQLLGKITAPILDSQINLPYPMIEWIAQRSIDWYVMSEDLPNPESRMTIRNDRIILDWQRSNWQANSLLVSKFKNHLRKAGWPIVLSKAFDRTVPSHQCGTVRFGNSPESCPLNIWCQAHDHSNLFVVDASFLPNSAAVNPALTIAAQALRVADHIKEKLLK